MYVKGVVETLGLSGRMANNCKNISHENQWVLWFEQLSRSQGFGEPWAKSLT